tara:strand:+ start:1875 stop:2369 length:495 start_codon:yes stop_codon:yes gene_type:complete
MSRVVVNEIEAKVGNDITFNDTVKISTAQIDTVRGKTTAGSITIQGEGTATTNLQQGLAKLWIRYQSSAIQDSLNVSSLTDGGTNSTNCTIAFTNNFDDASHYCPHGEFRGHIDGASGAFGHARMRDSGNGTSTSQLIYSVSNNADTAMFDWVACQASILGDLA